jgi:hypothetical protein
MEEKIFKEVVEKVENLVFVDDCEDYEGWSGKCLLYSPHTKIPKNITYCYLGKDSCDIKSDGGEMQIEYDENEIWSWKLSFDFYELVDFIETIKPEVVPEVEEELQKIVKYKIEEIKNEISVLQYEISRLESLLS